MAACSEGAHLFCCGCVNQYVNEEFHGNNRSSFQCMSGDGCTGTYPKEMLDKALSPRLMKNIEKHSFRAEVAKVGLNSLWQCPGPDCEYLADSEGGPMFLECPECHHKSCKLCKEAPHKNQTCEEAEAAKAKASAHTQMAEAMTEAVMRVCPGCSTRIMKGEGCNKMTCTTAGCNTKFCYVCRKTIGSENYNHFCTTPLCTHESCGKCVLFTKTEDDDKRARRAAGMKQKEALGKAAEDVGLLSPEKQAAVKSPAPQRAWNNVNAAAAPVAVAPAAMPAAAQPRAYNYNQRLVLLTNPFRFIARSSYEKTEPSQGP